MSGGDDENSEGMEAGGAGRQGMDVPFATSRRGAARRSAGLVFRGRSHT